MCDIEIKEEAESAQEITIKKLYLKFFLFRNRFLLQTVSKQC